MLLPTAIVWIRVISPTISNDIGYDHRLVHGLHSNGSCLLDRVACQRAQSSTSSPSRLAGVSASANLALSGSTNSRRRSHSRAAAGSRR
jgi:hypothetical protein